MLLYMVRIQVKWVQNPDAEASSDKTETGSQAITFVPAHDHMFELKKCYPGKQISIQFLNKLSDFRLLRKLNKISLL